MGLTEVGKTIFELFSPEAKAYQTPGYGSDWGE